MKAFKKCSVMCRRARCHEDRLVIGACRQGWSMAGFLSNTADHAGSDCLTIMMV